jgi:hypothetical protein
MDCKRHPVNLKQYRKLRGKWQFPPDARDAKGIQAPRLVLELVSKIGSASRQALTLEAV